MTTVKKSLLIGLPAAALIVGGGVGIGLAATSGPQPTPATPAGTQVLVATTQTDTGVPTAKQVQVKHADRHDQPARHTDERQVRDRDRDRDRDCVGQTEAAKARVATRTTQHTEATHRSGLGDDHDSGEHHGSAHDGRDR